MWGEFVENNERLRLKEIEKILEITLKFFKNEVKFA